MTMCIFWAPFGIRFANVVLNGWSLLYGGIPTPTALICFNISCHFELMRFMSQLASVTTRFAQLERWFFYNRVAMACASMAS